MPYYTPAQINAETAVCAQARRSATVLVKQRARAYAKRPMTLETLCPGLAAASPGTMLTLAKQLFEKEQQSPRRWLGFGGEVTVLNAKAALLLARTRRRAKVRFPAT